MVPVVTTTGCSSLPSSGLAPAPARCRCSDRAGQRGPPVKWQSLERVRGAVRGASDGRQEEA